MKNNSQYQNILELVKDTTVYKEYMSYINTNNLNNDFENLFKTHKEPLACQILALLAIISHYKQITPNNNFKISSSYRNEEKNKQVGGAKESKHLMGLAVDLNFESYNDKKNEKIILEILGKNYLILDAMDKTLNLYDIVLGNINNSDSNLYAIVKNNIKFLNKDLPENKDKYYLHLGLYKSLNIIHVGLNPEGYKDLSPARYYQ